jgi:hypothetical protein
MHTTLQFTQSSSVQNNENTLQVPFDVALPPPNLQTDDAPNQSIALTAALFGHDIDHDGENRFEDQRRRRRPLSYFQQMYEHKQTYQALHLLSNRTEVDFLGSPHITRNDDEDLAWNVDRHFLDLMICVGNGLGLGALLPNLQVHHNYEMTLDLKQPYRSFSAKFAKLGFDPQGCMQWIGRSPASEDVWLAWIPRASLVEGCEDVPVGTCSGNTQLKTSHYRMSVMFLAKMLRDIGVQDILVWEDYPSLDDDTEFQMATNIM